MSDRTDWYPHYLSGGDIEVDWEEPELDPQATYLHYETKEPSAPGVEPHYVSYRSEDISYCPNKVQTQTDVTTWYAGFEEVEENEVPTLGLKAKVNTSWRSERQTTTVNRDTATGWEYETVTTVTVTKRHATLRRQDWLGGWLPRFPRVAQVYDPKDPRSVPPLSRKCCQGNIFSGFLMVENMKKCHFYRTLFYTAQL